MCILVHIFFIYNILPVWKIMLAVLFMVIHGKKPTCMVV